MSIVLLVLGALIAPIAYKLKPKASCTDGIQNQGERSIDCEGPCPNICVNLLAPVRVVWARPFKVEEGVFSAAAYISNPNFGLGAKNVSYEFKLYDQNNILIGTRSGRTDILPNSTYPIFEGVIVSENRIPTKAFFEFTAQQNWVKLPEQPVLNIKNPVLTNASTTPRLTADIVNDNIFPIDTVRVTAVLYDENDNAVAGSETVIDRMEKSSNRVLVFTWPKAFTSSIGRIEIYPKFIKE
jgi:hypothetical protein